MEEYIRKVLEQVRCQKAHPAIRAELESHLSDQAAAYRREGMNEQEAQSCAVRDMGDPEETGRALDKIHRPQHAWDLLFLMGVITAISIAVHLAFGESGTVWYALAGFGVMTAVYFLDYTVLLRHAIIIAAGLNLIYLAAVLPGISIRGEGYSIQILGHTVSVVPLLLLYLPVYGAVLYHYQGSSRTGIFKSLLWMAAPIMLAGANGSRTLMMVLLVSMLVLLSIAMGKGWFRIRVSGKIAAAILWGSTVLLVSSALLFLSPLREYDSARIQGFFRNDKEINYVTGTLRDTMAESSWIGGDYDPKDLKSETLTDVDMTETELLDFGADLLSYDKSLIFARIIRGFGMLMGLVILVVFTLLLLRVICMIRRQSNPLGLLPGVGCVLAIGIPALFNLLMNLGWFPYLPSFLPFLSAGGSYQLICYLLMGLLLSICRYRTIYSLSLDRA